MEFILSYLILSYLILSYLISCRIRYLCQVCVVCSTKLLHFFLSAHFNRQLTWSRPGAKNYNLNKWHNGYRKYSGGYNGNLISTANQRCLKPSGYSSTDFIWKLHCHWLNGLLWHFRVICKGPHAIECMMITFPVLKLECLLRTRSIPWLLMPWLLVSPGPQQPWYWTCWNQFFVFHDEEFQLPVFRNKWKCKNISVLLKLNCAWQGLTDSWYNRHLVPKKLQQTE